MIGIIIDVSHFESIFPMGIRSEDIYIASALHNACGVISIDY